MMAVVVTATDEELVVAAEVPELPDEEPELPDEDVVVPPLPPPPQAASRSMPPSRARYRSFRVRFMMIVPVFSPFQGSRL